jgi:hypothetical protein
MRGIDQEAWHGMARPCLAWLSPGRATPARFVQARSSESRLGPGCSVGDGKGSGRRMNHDTDRNGQRRGHYSAVRTSLPALASLLEPLYVRKQPAVGGQKRKPSEITHPPLLDSESAPKRSQRPSASSKR